MRRIVIAVALAAASLAVAGCSSDSDPEPPASTVDASVESVDDLLPAEPTGEQMADVGAGTTRENPAPAGSSVKMGAYEVSLGVTDRDATDAVLAENEFNRPPEDGSVFVMVPVTATLEGAESGTVAADVVAQFVGSDGITYRPGCELNDIPDALNTVGEIYSGATATGNVCASVPVGVVDGGTWVVMETVSFTDAREFFALQ